MIQKDPPPPLLYKFFRPASATLIGSGTVRFSQFAALNDPLEFITTTPENKLKAEIERLFREIHKTNFSDDDLERYTWERVNEMPELKQLPPALRAAFRPTIETFVRAQMPLMKDAFRRTMDVVIPAISIEFARKLVRGIRDGEVTIFSSTELWNSAPMWAHYASNWSGFVIGFAPLEMFTVIRQGKQESLSPRSEGGSFRIILLN